MNMGYRKVETPLFFNKILYITLTYFLTLQGLIEFLGLRNGNT